VFLTGKTGYSLPVAVDVVPDLTRETSTRPDPYPRVRVGSGRVGYIHGYG